MSSVWLEAHRMDAADFPGWNTPRFRVHPLSHLDRDEYRHLFTSSETMVELGGAMDALSVDRDFERLMRSDPSRRAGRWVWCIRARGNRDFQGITGLAWRKRFPEFPEIGTLLHPGAQHAGVATEVMTSLLAYSFSNLRVSAVFARHHPNHLAALKLVQRLGFEACDALPFSSGAPEWKWWRIVERSLIRGQAEALREMLGQARDGCRGLSHF